MTNPSIDSQLKEIRHLALDMDGTIYKGNTLFDFTEPFLRAMDELGIGVTLLTNNSSKSAEDYLCRLREMRLPVQADQLLTAGMATIDFLQANHTDYRRLFVLGTESLRREFTQAGYTLVGDEAENEPDAVVVGFDTELVYQRLCMAGYWIAQGKPYIATHPDLVCPTDQKTLLVDCGAICSCLTSATGKSPDIVLGKPHPVMLASILDRYQLQPYQMAMIGDRLSTDIAMACRAGTLGVLVLTGEATAQDAAESSFQPDLIVEDLSEFARLMWLVREPHEP